VIAPVDDSDAVVATDRVPAMPMTGAVSVPELATIEPGTVSAPATALSTTAPFAGNCAGHRQGAGIGERKARGGGEIAEGGDIGGAGEIGGGAGAAGEQGRSQRAGAGDGTGRRQRGGGW